MTKRKPTAARRAARPPRRDGRRPAKLGPVVGIGSSAGGLDALKRFFHAMPADSGAAFVVVPHLDPKHESLMVELLAKQAKMPVVEVTDGTRIQANRVYVIPPNHDLAISNGVLLLSKPPEPRGLQTAIDFFLRSLAEDQGQRAIGIVLSGTGSHGTLGLREIKLAGGMVMAQDPESAEYPQMPNSAIQSGVVDYVLPPQDLPTALVKYIEQPYWNEDVSTVPAEGEWLENLQRILTLLRSGAKYDFRCYRRNMLMRRVLRRMGLLHVGRLQEYVEYLRENPKEVRALRKDLLIGVTSFFREPAAFAVLTERVFPDLLERASAASGDSRRVRVWVPGCATGEEAYSIAMLLLEQIALAKKDVDIQVFATDLDEDALAIGRSGIYPESIAATVSPQRLQTFFTRADDHHYQVTKRLRDAIVFAPQDLISDAPFSKLDLISCRNLLIYLEPVIQAKVMAVFHFALNPGGYLMLGPAESIGSATDMFEPVAKKWRVFRRTGPKRRGIVDVPIAAIRGRRDRGPRDEAPARAPIDFAELIRKVVLTDLAPAAVLINHKFEVLAFLGPTVDYLEFPPGEPTSDLMSLARQGLRARIRTACQTAISTNRAVADTDVRVERQGVPVPCAINVRPIGEPKEAKGLLLVTFQDLVAPPSPRAAIEESGMAASGETKLVRQLEDELRASQSDLRSTIEEMEDANEELKASNEEIMSMNEELQSTNEELETSKEELQSLNEELSTVNQQLQDKVIELDQANSDMANLLNSSDIATVFLDTTLKIRHFTPATAKLLNLVATDIGRPLRDFAPKFTDDSLQDDCKTVLDELVPIGKEIRSDDGRTYLRRLLPYRTSDDHIAGAVVTFIDISDVKQAEVQSRRLATVLRDSNDAVLLYDFDGKISAWNHGAEKIYGYTEAEAVGMNIRSILPKDQRDQSSEEVRRLLRGEEIAPFETRRVTKDGRTLDVWITLTPLVDEDRKPIGVAATERDVSERNRRLAELESLRQSLEQRVLARTKELQEKEREFSALANNVPALFAYIDAAQYFRYVNRRYEKLLAMAPTEITGKKVGAVLSRNQYRRVGPYLRRALAGESVRFTSELQLPDGLHYFEEKYVPDFGEHGVVRGIFALANDVTAARRQLLELQESQFRLNAVVETAAEAIVTIDRGGIIQSFNPAAERMFDYAVTEAIGKNVNILMPSPYKENHDGYLRRYHQTGKGGMIGGTRELVGRHKDGSTFPLELSLSRVDHLDLFTGIIRDTSERKLAQDRERQHLDELAHVLRVATLGELASGLAHELNQPLTSISTNIQACLSRLRAGETTGENLSRALQHASDEALRAGNIVHSIRNLVEKRPRHEERFDLRVPTERACRLLEGEMAQHAINLELAGMKRPLLLRGDAVQIEQVFINLMQNAIESIREAGGRSRKLAVTLSRAAKNTVEVAVADTGTGIDKAAAERLFTPFYSTKSEGLGMGLALCQTIVEAHGGRLRLEPRRGRHRGATFRLTLPAHSIGGSRRSKRAPTKARLSRKGKAVDG